MTTKTRKLSSVPEPLSRGRAFYKDAVAGFELTRSELEILTEISGLLDEIESLRTAIEEDGTVTRTSAGVPKTHPALSEIRSHRLAAGRLIAQLGLPDVDGVTLPSQVSARARKAAQKRWLKDGQNG